MSHAIAYLKLNWTWLLPLIIFLLTNIANALTNHPQTKGILLFFSRLLDQLPTTVLAKKGAPDQTVKLPLAASRWPDDHPLNPLMVPGSDDKTGPKMISLLLPFLVLGGLLAATLLAGCGLSALEFSKQSVTTAARIEADALPGINAVIDHREQAIVDQARSSGATQEATRAQIANFRATADKVKAALHTLADAIKVAKAALDAVQSGISDLATVAPLLGKIFAAALDLATQAKAIGVTIPGLDKLVPASAFSQPPPTARLLYQEVLQWT